ncbi:MAG: hypothetical protein ACK5JT_15630, partial [Hyphomicrobiaceae bacterium]
GVVVAAILGFAMIQSVRVSSQIEAGMRALGVNLSAAEIAERAAAKKAEQQKALDALASITDYETARWYPLHFQPAIATATNEQCLACHSEILNHKVRKESPAGVKSATSLAWYETLDTYKGEQATFHARHLTTEYARSVMKLDCNFCHKGNDPRDEAPHTSATGQNTGFTLRKVVDPSATCLMCHGKFPGENMNLGSEPWSKLRHDLETAEAPNGCLTCHAEQFRTVRHQVSFLKADDIEALAKKGSSDVCYGCHGGRAWYRISYPYPRHPWPGMDQTVPDWAKGRPTESDPLYSLRK